MGKVSGGSKHTEIQSPVLITLSEGSDTPIDIDLVVEEGTYFGRVSMEMQT